MTATVIPFPTHVERAALIEARRLARILAKHLRETPATTDAWSVRFTVAHGADFLAAIHDLPDHLIAKAHAELRRAFHKEIRQ